ncbi:signal transduction histidine kinase [Xenococcus sp. PCC 7305]|uniref:hybrid sensor histidine kinase/response regulator n=1 Tax=Xenococcus sp. PCC 7305 TaxID=102125 RepID=UPI0002ACA426|nr:hybrid sensor histidine kinase/response regulator [Xenococcus sp. PCC 7305]ELS03554.1 signal transduction histidine kinase [Xenococcus sp. PCC 7305]
MAKNSVEILLIEDDPAEARLLKEVLKSFNLQSFSLVHVNRLQAALEKLKCDYFDVILLDLTLPDSQGLSSVETIVDQAPNLPIVVLTNTNDDNLAIEAVRRGAQDYLIKRKINVEVLVRSIKYAIERQRASEILREANESLVNQIQTKTDELIKVREIDRLKSGLFSMFSHDFRNPLTTVLACAELLQKKSHLLTEEKKVHLFDLLRGASKNMSQLLDEVLLVGRADSGTSKCNLVNLDLTSLCRQIVDELQIIADKKQIEIIFISQNTLPESSWDESLLRHILSNLLSNAIKYSLDNSQIKFELIAEDKQVVFRIQDWGIGIPQADIPHLFEPFHRANNVERIPGTGLGLAIVKNCVETHRGYINLESEVGLGSIVTVTIPFTFS